MPLQRRCAIVCATQQTVPHVALTNAAMLNEGGAFIETMKPVEMQRLRGFATSDTKVLHCQQHHPPPYNMSQ